MLKKLQQFMSNQRVESLREHYIIKNDGAVTLDLKKALNSEKFRESIALITEQELEPLTTSHRAHQGEQKAAEA